MAVAKVQVLATLNGAGVWRVVAPLNPIHVRHLSPEELNALAEAIPRLIDSVMNRSKSKPLEPAGLKK